MQATSVLKTKAVVFVAEGEVAMEEVEVRPPGPGEIQVRTHFSTISAGTERWQLQNLFTWLPTPFPCLPGYQRSGVVTAIGVGVSGWRIGDRAFATISSKPCEAFDAVNGAHIGVANSPAHEVYHLHEKIDEMDASAAVVAQVGYNAASRATYGAGDYVVIYGDGLVGQCAAQVARARGARTIMVGLQPDRLKLGSQFSADFVIHGAAEDVVASVRRVSQADTVAVILDNVQTPESQKQYIDLLKPGRGQIVYNGFTPRDQWADMGLLQIRELTTHFVSGWNRQRLEATLELMGKGVIRVRPLITNLVPCDEAPEAYRLLSSKNPEFLVITLDWTLTAEIRN